MSTATPIRPVRSSLVSETVKALRHEIAAGRWQGFLPGERVLCSQWQISRPTLRAAVEVLRREKLLEVGQGRRTRVLVPQTAGPPSTLTVGLLSPESLQAMPPAVMLWVDELRGELAAAGHLLQITVGSAGFGRKNPAHALAAVISATPAAAWVLYQSTEAMQRWFEEHEIPCIVVGSTFPGRHLPSVDRDYRSACRHAVGTLARRGHRRVAFLGHTRRFGGDLESEDGFEEGVAAAQRHGVTGEVLHHDGTPEGICGQIDCLLATRQRPTALLVARSSYALAAHSHLLRRGIRLPQDLALICRDDDQFLDWVVPRMTRYTVSPAVFAKRLYSLVLRLVEEGHVREQSVKVMPVYLGRETV
jgi:LacI family transcriptional regulator